MKILMVCLGNICRSPLAEGILSYKTKHLNVSVDSAGTAAYHIGELPDKRSIAIAKKYNIDLSNQRARQFSRKDFEEFDIIYAMDTSNYAHLISLSKTKKETMFIQILEVLHADEANLLVNVKDKSLNKVYKGLTDAVVKEAFGWNDIYKTA